MRQAKEWWQSAFGRTYYETFEPLFPVQTKRETAFLMRHLNKKLGIRRVLDLAYGHGRHSIALAEHEYNVTGVDYSADSIYSAEVKAKEKNLNVRFLKGDIAGLRLHEKFDAVLLLGNALGYRNLQAKILMNACLLCKLKY